MCGAQGHPVCGRAVQLDLYAALSKNPGLSGHPGPEQMQLKILDVVQLKQEACVRLDPLQIEMGSLPFDIAQLVCPGGGKGGLIIKVQGWGSRDLASALGCATDRPRAGLFTSVEWG